MTTVNVNTSLVRPIMQQGMAYLLAPPHLALSVLLLCTLYPGFDLCMISCRHWISTCADNQMDKWCYLLHRQTNIRL